MLRAYLTNLAAYNNGELRGEWIDLPIDEDELKEAMKRVLGDDEEYFITDYDSDVAGLAKCFGEYDPIDGTSEIIQELEGANIDQDLLEIMIEHSGDIQDVLNVIEGEAYNFIPGINSERELGEYVVENWDIEIPEQLMSYIDYEAIGENYCRENGGTIYVGRGFFEMY